MKTFIYTLIFAMTVTVSTVANADIIVNFTDGGTDADALANNSATAADFQTIDSNISAASTVDLINGDAFTDGTAVGSGITADLTIGIGQNGFTPDNAFGGVPISGGYLFANVGGGNPGVEVILNNISGINAGDTVIVTLFATGDATNQTNGGLLGVNGGALTAFEGGALTTATAAPGDLAAASLQETFIASAAVTDLTLQAVAGGSQFTSINGFSVSVIPAAVPEPSALALLGLGSLATLVRRRRG